MKRIIVKGRVQGVFFRENTKKKADELNISGTVRNMSDGSVEVYADGERMDEFLAWLRLGPRSAKVEEVIVQNVDKEVPEGFSVIWSSMGSV